MGPNRAIVAAILSVALEVHATHAFVSPSFQPLLRSSTSFKTCPTTYKAPAASVELRGPRKATFHSSVQMMTAAVAENPLLALGVFPQFNEIKAEQVVPGFTQIIQSCDDDLAAFEAELQKNDFTVEISSFLGKLEALSDGQH